MYKFDKQNSNLKWSMHSTSTPGLFSMMFLKASSDITLHLMFSWSLVKHIQYNACQDLVNKTSAETNQSVWK